MNASINNVNMENSILFCNSHFATQKYMTTFSVIQVVNIDGFTTMRQYYIFFGQQ